jgi:hypothetical protein
MAIPMPTNIRPHSMKKGGAGFPEPNASKRPLAANVQNTGKAVKGIPKSEVFQWRLP